LDEHLAGTDGNTHGIMAISLSRILNPGDKFFAREEERLGDILERHVRDNERYWATADLNKSISAVLFHAATPADSGKGLLRMTYSVGAPVNGETPAFQAVAAHLRRLYE
jgi:hypothetical protein